MVWTILSYLAGTITGLLLAAIMGAAGRQAHREELRDTYHAGYLAGKGEKS